MGHGKTFEGFKPFIDVEILSLTLKSQLPMITTGGDVVSTGHLLTHPEKFQKPPRFELLYIHRNRNVLSSSPKR